MSNDGDFANMIMHPRSHLEKIYEVTIKGLIKGEDLHHLEKGVYLEGKKQCLVKSMSLIKIWNIKQLF